MFIRCLIAAICTGVISAGVLHALGSGLTAILLGYSLTGAAALLLAMRISRIIDPDWTALP